MGESIHPSAAEERPAAQRPGQVPFRAHIELLQLFLAHHVRPDAVTHFSLEDVFADGETDKLAWVSGWRK